MYICENNQYNYIDARKKNFFVLNAFNKFVFVKFVNYNSKTLG